MIDNQVPSSPESEAGVLGAILIDDSNFGSLDLSPQDFFSEPNQIIYQAMLNTKGQIDEITVAHELQRMGKTSEAGGLSYLPHLVSVTPTSIHLKYYAEIVKKCAINRRVISVAGQIEAVGYQNKPTLESIDAVNQTIKGLISTVKDDSVLTPENISLNAIDFLTNTSKHKSIGTGIQSFDDIKSGYMTAEYVMIGGRTGKGKTTLALQQARHIAKTKHVLFFSMEMMTQQVTNKNIACLTGLPERAIAMKGVYSEEMPDGRIQRHNGFTDPQWKSILDAIDKLSKLNLYIAEGNRSLDTIRRLVEMQLNSVGCDIVFIDYLGLIKERQGKDGHDRYNFLSEELSRMPKEYKIPFVVLHQQNREIEYRTAENRNPKLTDLREGGEESPDLIIILARTDNLNVSELHILKDRIRGEPCIIAVDWNSGTYS